MAGSAVVSPVSSHLSLGPSGKWWNAKTIECEILPTGTTSWHLSVSFHMVSNHMKEQYQA